MIDKEKLEDVKVLAYKNEEDSSYGIALASLVWKTVPEELKAKILKNCTEEIALNIFKDILPQVMPKDDFKRLVKGAEEDETADLIDIYHAVFIDSIVDATHEAGVKLIAEADSEEEVKDSTKTLTEMLNKDAIPNILQTISSVVTKEVKKSNEELEKIEDNENSLKQVEEGKEEEGNNSAFNNTGDDEGDDETTTDSNSDNGDNNGDTASNQDSSKDTGEDDSKESENTPDEEENSKKEGREDTGTKTAGEDGEIFAESIREKYFNTLKDNPVYIIKNAISKYIYNMEKSGHPVNETTVAHMSVGAYGILVLGYILSNCGIVEFENYIWNAKEKLKYDSTKASVEMIGD